MNILIYGGGAVGLGIANCLLKAGVSTDILARSKTIKSLKENGLIRTGIFGSYTAESSDFNCFTEFSECGNKLYTHVLVCTKSFDSESAAQDISKHKTTLDNDGVIVLFQNGWGNAEIFSRYFKKNLVYNARVITGFIRPEHHHVKITVHADSVHIGSLYNDDLSPIEPICSAISKGGLPCEFSKSIVKDLWAKMLYNCALNPLGAVLNVPYGKLGEKKETKDIMENIINEIYIILKRTGYSTYWEKAEDYIKVFYSNMLPPTALHESSMLQDLRAGKTTEINALCGAVIELATTYNMDAPYNKFMYNLIKAME